MSETNFKFTSADVTIELSGSEEFVERQIKFFQGHMVSAGEVELPQAESTNGSAPAHNGNARGDLLLDDFFRARATRAGRGAIQEALLLFGFYLQEIEGLNEFSIDQLGASFGAVGRPVPKNLHHAVGTLKRKQGWFVPGSRRGTYRVAPVGMQLVKPVRS